MFVTKTLIVRTMTEVTTACVFPATLETEWPVQVRIVGEKQGQSAPK